MRKRGWMLAKRFGKAPAAAIESDVREAGRIVVCVEAIPEVITERTTRNASGPSTSSETAPSTPALSSKRSIRSRPA